MDDADADTAYGAKSDAEMAAQKDEWNARMAEYDARWRAFRERKAAVLPGNKAALFAALAAAGIASITVMFDGSGDSGQIEDIGARNAKQEPIELPDIRIEITDVQFDKPEVPLISQMSVREVVEALTYEFLEQTHDGWENDDGAYGEFTFDVAEQTIRLEYNERYTETHYHEHEF